ncbi:hypothetical protein [Pseudactinotalea sp. Z1732]|uniref:hypothetical protein n=1 Tax=Micrococcales TaxID=85006 RepID=UPI003C7A27EE
MATTIKLSKQTRDRVNDVGARTGQTAEQVVRRALEEYERALFWADYGAAAAAERVDPEVAADQAEENALWDAATARDGSRRG